MMPQAVQRSAGMVVFHSTGRDTRGDMQFSTEQLSRSVPAPNPIRARLTRRRRAQRIFMLVVLALCFAIIAAGYVTMIVERCS